MKWSPRTVYLYLVSFAALLMLVFGTVNLVNGIIAWFEPDWRTGGLPYIEPLTPEETAAESREIAMRNTYAKLHPELSESEINALARERLAEEKRFESATAVYYRVRRLLEPVTLVILALPIYLYHWRRAQRGV